MKQLKLAAEVVKELNNQIQEVFSGSSPITFTVDTNGSYLVLTATRLPISCHCPECDPDEDQLSLEACRRQLAAIGERLLIAFDDDVDDFLQSQDDDDDDEGDDFTSGHGGILDSLG